MTIKEIDKMIQDRQANHQSMIERQKEAERNAVRLNEEAEAAAVAGDVQKYRDLKSEAIDQESLAYVIGKQIENDDDRLDEAEALDAWKKYRADYEKKLNAGMKTFRETKLTMLRTYAEMVSLQREACATRERLSRYIGKIPSPVAAGRDKMIEGRFPMEYLPCIDVAEAGALSIIGARIEDPDAAYYLSSFGKNGQDLANDPEAHMVYNVVKDHRA